MLSAQLERLVLRFFEDLGTPFSLMCAILWRAGDRGALVRLECRPEWYRTSDDYFRSVAALGFVKKLQGVAFSDEERAAAAVKKWFEGEANCYKTNQRLYPFLRGSNLVRDERIAHHVDGVRKIVGELIGFRPPPLVEGRFGPGATYADRGYQVSVPHKITSSPTLTSDACWYLVQFYGTAWGASTAARNLGPTFVRGNRFTTVPKTSLTDRSIAIEPSINVFFQLGYGRALRERLLNAGWDLNVAADTHRRKAESASKDHEFATLDLSNASDTMSYNLVKLLLPRAWFEALKDLRSAYTSHPSQGGGWVKLEKFSSMGNGYTFELETVLFAAMALYASRQAGHQGVLGVDTFVFGDDIIVKDDVTRGLTALLNFFGFELNREKSYSGLVPFRESCGADYFDGQPVRPAYIREDPATPVAAIGVANRIGAVARQLGIDPRRFPSWRMSVSFIPLPFRHFGPLELGDAVINHCDTDLWRVRWRHSIRYVRGVATQPRSLIRFAEFDPSVVLACALYGTGNTGTPQGSCVLRDEGVIPRNPSLGFRTSWFAFS